MADENEASENPEAEGEEEEGSGGGKKKLLFIVIPAVLVLVLGGGAAAFFLLSGGGDDAETVAEAPAAASGAGEDAYAGGEGAASEDGYAEPVNYDAPEASGKAYFYELPKILVNIDGGEGRTTYLSLQLTLEIPNDRLKPILDERLPVVMDQYQAFLRELRPADLTGAAGTFRLRLELLRRANLAIAPERINAVLIQEMLIQ